MKQENEIVNRNLHPAEKQETEQERIDRERRDRERQHERDKVKNQEEKPQEKSVEEIPDLHKKPLPDTKVTSDSMKSGKDVDRTDLTEEEEAAEDFEGADDEDADVNAEKV